MPHSTKKSRKYKRQELAKMAREKIRLAKEKARKEGHAAAREGKKSGEIMKKKKRKRGNTSMGLTGSEIVEGSDEEGPPVSALPASIEKSETVEFFDQGPSRGVSSGSKKGKKQSWLLKNGAQSEGRAEDNKKRMQMLLWKRFNGRNACFEEYYRRQCLVDSSEFDAMLQKFGEPLPITFRLNPRHPEMEATDERLQVDFNMRPGELLKVNGKRIEFLVKPVECIKGVSVWQCSVDRSGLRHSKGSLKGLHHFVVESGKTGILSRQELVSMVPVYLLDVEPHHMVLDLCAAPGSKTSQLQELMGSIDSTGLIVANDNDAARSQTLLGVTNRCQALGLTVPVALTCHDGVTFPAPTLCTDEKSKKKGKQKSNGGFDRVLVDVPCSGDGTLRKYPELLRKWETSWGMRLHKTQLKLAKRAAQLLKVDGLLVYSTCSLNPIENESVVAALLEWSEGALELVEAECKLKDVADAEAAAAAAAAEESEGRKEASKLEGDKKKDGKKGGAQVGKVGVVVVKVNKKKNKKQRRRERQMELLQQEEEEEEEEERGRGTVKAESSSASTFHPLSGMVYRPGHSTWSVAVGGAKGKGEEDESVQKLRWFNSFDAAKKAGIKDVAPTMWAPSAKVQQGLNLQRCVRFLPMDNDSSGFFCAKLRLTRPLPEAKQCDEGGVPQTKRKTARYEPIPEELWEELKELFGIDLEMDDMDDEGQEKKLQREQCWLRKAGSSRSAAGHTSVVIASPKLG
jgi:16S rRNA C967 or C1407 C5-methylase (RsmB/RsmF family)